MSGITEVKIYQKQDEVRKNNSLIRCNNVVTAVQRKSFAIMLKTAFDVILTEGEKKYYEMPLAEYKKLMGYGENVKTKDIRDSLKELKSKELEWDVDKDGYGVYSNMLSAFELKKDTGILKWAFSPFLIEKIIADGYTPLKLSTLLSFDSKYALALYENLQAKKNFKKTEFLLAEFRALMGVGTEEYQRMDLFKTRVLHVAINEINEKGDMKIFYEDIKQRAKIVGFRFDWTNLTADEMMAKNQKQEKVKEYQKLLSPNFGMKFKIAGRWYTLTKNGWIGRGKNLNGNDIVDSYEQYKLLDAQGFVTEKKGWPQGKLME